MLRPLLLVAFAIAAGAGTGPAGAQVQVVTYGFEVLEKRPQPRENFVQGLQIVGDTLYVGTGLYGESRLLAYDFPDMTLRQEVRLPEHLFGEGVTRLGDRIYQLTWRAGQLLVYDAGDFTRVASAKLATEGWGITHDGERLIYSDGSPVLRYLGADSLAVERELPVTLGNRPLPRLNELEFIDGEIWANVWQANQLVRIDPSSGAVTGIVDLRGLLDPADRAPDTDVLNGIAWDSESRALWVTGKRWPWLYRLRIFVLPGVS
jgi:glutamine cyclotransferase